MSWLFYFTCIAQADKWICSVIAIVVNYRLLRRSSDKGVAIHELTSQASQDVNASWSSANIQLMRRELHTLSVPGSRQSNNSLNGARKKNVDTLGPEISLPQSPVGLPQIRSCYCNSSTWYCKHVLHFIDFNQHRIITVKSQN